MWNRCGCVCTNPASFWWQWWCSLHGDPHQVSSSLSLSLSPGLSSCSLPQVWASVTTACLFAQPEFVHRAGAWEWGREELNSGEWEGRVDIGHRDAAGAGWGVTVLYFSYYKGQHRSCWTCGQTSDIQYKRTQKAQNYKLNQKNREEQCFKNFLCSGH